MRIPCVIDNRTYKLAAVLNAILAERAGNSPDIAFESYPLPLRRQKLFHAQACFSDYCS